MSDIVIVSEDINEIFEKELNNCGLIVVKVRKNKNLYTAIRSHADIALCPIGRTIIVEASRYDDIFLELNDLNYNILRTDPIENGSYPYDIKLNLAYTDTYAIHNLKYTDKQLLKILGEKEENMEIEFIDVKQGYSKCSILIVDNKSIITSDNGIYLSLKDKLDCLLIKKGHIKLTGLEYGFIGGATGRYKDEIWFYGDISKHPDYNQMRNFIEGKNLSLRYFKDFELEDIGSIFFIKDCKD